MKVFVAGASGAVGKQLVPMLVERGHEVTGMTRSPAKRDLVRRRERVRWWPMPSIRRRSHRR